MLPSVSKLKLENQPSPPAPPQGCASWKWYFPYHYAPFASDFVDLDDVPTEFERDTKPFNPLEQLMGVFPAASRAHVPK